jgi:hypothetical protein
VSARRCALAALLAACAPSDGETGAARDPAGVAAPASASPAPAAPARPGIRFDPATLRPGGRVGALVADSVAARWAPAGEAWVGAARFRGELTLAGRTVAHPEPDARVVCFEADSASAAQLPRWAGDERRPWFCFEPTPEAARALGPPGTERAATVVVDRFTIERGLTDQVNSARLVRVARPPVPG